ncbi:AraC family transcriptional regulator [Candidatus Skiveiella danica]|uniref:AraC family transcriptional regulator n=1 Tax=Candidatus Skiveiella danica TaxID=3386177 RepID=UPI001DCCD5C4|nr:AraC family transcriptional regulator [Betaproteobacteria bacterium]
MNIHLATSLRVPQQGMIRAAPLASLPGAMRELEVDLAPIVAALGLSARVFEDPEESIAYRTLCALMATCARASACPHLGLLVGRHGGLKTLGALGYLVQNAPDVRTAIDTLIVNMDVHDRGAAPTLELRASVAMLRYDIFHADAEGSIPVSDAAMAIGRNIMLSLCGPAWKPLEVHFRHAPPDNVTPYRQFFQAPVVFNAKRTALVFGTHWLQAAVPGADDQLRRHFESYVDAMTNQLERGFVDKVYPAVQRLVVENRCSLENLALRFSMHPRTLNRRLQAAGTSFRALQNRARHDLAREMLRDTTSEVATIANLLGYTSVSAFNRAFSGWEGMPPVAWRRYTEANKH